MSNRKIKIALLLGAGISLPSGRPSTDEITERILSGENVLRTEDEIYRLNSPPDFYRGESDEYIPRILAFLKRIKTEIDGYYSIRRRKHKTNYEDLYYVAGQLYDNETGEYDNPAVQALRDKIMLDPDIQSLLVGWKDHIYLFYEAVNYISDVACGMFPGDPSGLSHFGFIEDVCKDGDISNVDIFTLNHDKDLESYLRKKGVHFVDGFEEIQDEAFFRWNADLFDYGGSKIRFFKLHGSINWFWFRRDMKSAYSVLIPKGGFWNKNPFFSDRPIILLGTFNKMLDYLGGIFIELYGQFHNSLKITENLIVCGYGFRDKGINQEIVNWVNSSTNNMMIIVEPNPDNIRNTARRAISNRIDEWENERRVCIIPNGIESASWNDIKSIVTNGGRK
ncbi:MAG: hypothetical protein AB1546_06590 [bacterium]